MSQAEWPRPVRLTCRPGRAGRRRRRPGALTRDPGAFARAPGVPSRCVATSRSDPGAVLRALGCGGDRLGGGQGLCSA
ncbi:protein of unknown function [Candidatus Methylocalor cossyra]|uniref:Uncharacterized protein n=1 Tax=Candidatus Methylocalor cossyra TaxID=3108543 RepID=A0ABP1C692_9GAMM